MSSKKKLIGTVNGARIFLRSGGVKFPTSMRYRPDADGGRATVLEAVKGRAHEARAASGDIP
jgi:hypothetical protein